MTGARTNDRLVRASDMEALMCRWCNRIRFCRAAEKDRCRCISDIRMTATAPTGKETTRLQPHRSLSFRTAFDLDAPAGMISHQYSGRYNSC